MVYTLGIHKLSTETITHEGEHIKNIIYCFVFLGAALST